MPYDIHYKPLDTSTLAPGTTVYHATNEIVERIGDNDRWVNTSYTPCLFASVIGAGPDTSPTVLHGAATNAGSGAPEPICRWIIMGNTIRRTVALSIQAAVSAGSTTGTLTITYGGATVTQSVTATSPQRYDIEITPTSGTAPLELLITGYTDNSNYVTVMAAAARYKAADRIHGGEGADGYIPFGDLQDGSYSAGSPVAANKPISTELLSRGWNNMRALARDRVACLATLQRPQNSTGRGFNTAYGTDPVLVGRLWVPRAEGSGNKRPGRLSWHAYSTGGGGTAGLIVAKYWGAEFSDTVTAAPGAWTHKDIDLMYLGGEVQFYATRTAGAGTIHLSAAQVFREP